MDQLEGDRDLDGIISPRQIDTGGGVVDEEDDGRADPFSAGVDQVTADRAEPRLARIELLGQATLDAGEVGGDGCGNLERIRQIGGVG